MLMALLLDAANIVGGLLLAIPLLGRFPVIARLTARIAGWRWLVGIVALVAGGYFLIVHLISGPHLVHFEVVGIATFGEVGSIGTAATADGPDGVAEAVVGSGVGAGVDGGGGLAQPTTAALTATLAERSRAARRRARIIRAPGA